MDTLGKGRELFSEVITLMAMYYALPTSSAIAEKSLSSLRRRKTYLRSTMTETRLNNLLIVHVHKKRNDKLNVRMLQCYLLLDTKTEARHLAGILTADISEVIIQA